jgi:hypothetical protein
MEMPTDRLSPEREFARKGEIVGKPSGIAGLPIDACDPAEA